MPRMASIASMASTTATLVIASIVVTLAGAAQGAEKKVRLQDVPASVQKAIADAGRGATLKGVTTEQEKGKTLYEAEYRIGRRSKDVTFDAQGGVVSVEEETELSALPAGARSAIEKAAGTGKIVMIETVTEGGATSYEAHLSNAGKTTEIKVDAFGKRLE
jgi:uncharacterized membrane protein YkoI